MKEKIIAAFKTKYQRFGLSNEAVDRIASAKEKTVTKDEDIETALADVETMTLIATEVQKMRDGEIQRRTDLQKSFDTYKEKHPEQTPPTPPAPKKEPEPTPEPEWARNLRLRFEREDKEKADKIARDAIVARLKMEGCTNNGILNLTLKGYSPKEGETEDAAVERLKGEYNASYKETFGEGAIPPIGGQTYGDAKTAIDHKNKFLEEQGLLPANKK